MSAGFSDAASIASILFVVVSFAAGFYWQYRRARQGKPFMSLSATVLVLGVVLLVGLVVGVYAWYYRPTVEYIRWGPR